MGIHVSVKLNNVIHVVCLMILGLQCLDPRSVRILMGYDGTFLEHSTCAGQSSGSSVWRGHLRQAYGKILLVLQASQTQLAKITPRLLLHIFSTQQPAQQTALSFVFIIDFCISNLRRSVLLTLSLPET